MTKPNPKTNGRAPSFTHRWRRFLGVGCSHGIMADAKATAATLRFKAAWQPDYTFHLGDAMDTAAYRSGASGSKDQGADSQTDMRSGLDYVRALEPQTWFMGNHEDRLFSLARHWNAVVKDAATSLVKMIEDAATELSCAVVPYRGCHNDGFRMLGDYKLTHGYLYNENACRDMAEAHGNVIFAHTHRAGVAVGRRGEEARGICVGTLSDIPAMDYAKCRRATLSWSQGFVWGEYTDKRCVPQLFIQPKGMSEWRLPL